MQAASNLLYTGRRIDADEASRIGLVDQVVEKDELMVAARAMAEDIAGSAPLSVAAIRRTLREGLVAEVERMLKTEWADQTRLKLTEDFGEGVSAMTERRQPQFRGR
jgi:enoyl-CoA hydratase/carnithine racemase